MQAMKVLDDAACRLCSVVSSGLANLLEPPCREFRPVYNHQRPKQLRIELGTSHLPLQDAVTIHHMDPQIPRSLGSARYTFGGRRRGSAEHWRSYEDLRFDSS